MPSFAQKKANLKYRSKTKVARNLIDVAKRNARTDEEIAADSTKRRTKTELKLEADSLKIEKNIIKNKIIVRLKKLKKTRADYIRKMHKMKQNVSEEDEYYDEYDILDDETGIHTLTQKETNEILNLINI